MLNKPEKDGPLTTALREAVKKATEGGLVAFSNRIGVDPAVVSRFRNGGGLTLVVADRLALALGLELRPTKKKGA